MRLDFLRSLYEDGGSRANRGNGEFGTRYVSLYLDVTPTKQDAATEVALRWRAARERLAEAGADAATLDAVEQAATRREHGVSGRAIFARDGAVRFEGALPWPPRQELANLAPLPHVMPWLAQLPAQVPHVRVAAGRAGAQVLAVPAARTAPETSSTETTVEGTPWPVHKVSTGGWSEQRLQRSTEENWAANAKRIAGAAVAEAERSHAEFLVIGGDVRERSMVVDLLPPPLRAATVTVDREVAADDAAFAEAARTEEERRRAQEDRALLDELRTRLAGPGAEERRAVTGLAGTLAALRDGLASDVLLIDEPSWDPPAVWAGPDLADVATERAALAERGVTALLQARADAAVVRAVAGTGAELHLVPAELAGEAGEADAAGQIAALLRAPAAAF